MANSLPLANFVNREEEMRFIENQCISSLIQSRPVRQQFVEFYGVGGIGKTTILRHIEQHCHSRQSVFPIWTDASQDISNFSQEIIKQVQNFGIVLPPLVGNPLDQSIYATRALLHKGPAIFFIDSLDAATDEQLSWIENMLYRFIENNTLLFIMASKKEITFDKSMTVMRRLKTVPLKSFSRKHCDAYIQQIAPNLSKETNDLIYKWTRGYPLAVGILVETVDQEQPDLTTEIDQKRLLSVINERVIQRGVLADVAQSPTDLEWFRTMLSIFSVPRRFNLSLMQKVTEEFVPQYKLSSSLAYMDLPRRFNRKTDVLSWNQTKSGFSLDPSIRPTFLATLKIEEPELFTQLNQFLANENARQATMVTSNDRIRYLLEYLYHSSCCTSPALMRPVIEKTLQRIFAEPLDSLSFFKEEFEQDEELQEELQELKELPLSLLYRHLAEDYKNLALNTTHPTERVTYLHAFFHNTVKDPIADRSSFSLSQTIEQIKQQESVEVCRTLFTVLSQDVEIIRLLGSQEAVLALLITG